MKESGLVAQFANGLRELTWEIFGPSLNTEVGDSDVLMPGEQSAGDAGDSFRTQVSVPRTDANLGHREPALLNAWCREGEFIFWRPDFSNVMRKFSLINKFRFRRRTCFGLI